MGQLSLCRLRSWAVPTPSAEPGPASLLPREEGPRVFGLLCARAGARRGLGVCPAFLATTGLFDPSHQPVGLGPAEHPCRWDTAVPAVGGREWTPFRPLAGSGARPEAGLQQAGWSPPRVLFCSPGKKLVVQLQEVASCVAWVVTVFGVPPSPAVCPRLGQRVPPKCTGGPWALLAPWVPSRRPLRGPELPSQAAVTSRRPGSHDASWWRESPAMRAGERGWGLGPGGGPGRALRF